MQRIATKVLRYSNNQNNGKKVDYIKSNSRADMLCCVIKGLEESIKDLTPSSIPTNFENGEKWLDDIDFYNVTFEHQTFELNELTVHSKAIKSTLLSYTKNFIVLKDGLYAGIMNDCLNSIRQVFAKQDINPIIVCSSTFKYMLLFYNPFIYTELIDKRSVPLGMDLLPDIQPPERYFLIKSLVEQTTNVLTFPQDQTLFSPINLNRFVENRLDDITNRFLFLKLYLEKGLIKPRYNECLAECRKHYPNYYKKISELKMCTENIGNGSLSQELFRIFKGMANDIHSSISTSDVLDNLFKTDQSESGSLTET